jgi:hypothetical protein
MLSSRMPIEHPRIVRAIVTRDRSRVVKPQGRSDRRRCAGRSVNPEPSEACEAGNVEAGSIEAGGFDQRDAGRHVLKGRQTAREAPQFRLAGLDELSRAQGGRR